MKEDYFPSNLFIQVRNFLDYINPSSAVNYKSDMHHIHKEAIKLRKF